MGMSGFNSEGETFNILPRLYQGHRRFPQLQGLVKA
jgi:hypothetical protein